MPDFSLTLIVAVLISLGIGLAIGWVLRAVRNQKEQEAINAGWREEVDEQDAESGRLTKQNSELLSQLMDCKATQTEAINRAAELASVLQEAYRSRDEAKPKLKQAARNLQIAETSKQKLAAEVADRTRKFNAVAEALKDKDKKIAELEHQLANWQSRIPPLVESYRQKSEQVRQLDAELRKLREVLNAFEDDNFDDQSGIEPMESGSLRVALDASNEASASGQNAAHGPLSGQDDLKKIKGIGPSVNSKLNDLGIFYFHQVASLSENDIDRISSHLKGFRNLLQRYDWIKQARVLRDLD